MKIFIEPEKNFTEEVKYILSVLAQNKSTSFTFVDRIENSDLTFGSTNSSNFTIAESFYESLSKGQFQFEHHLGGDCFIKTENGNDYISTAFYMINSLQEYHSSDPDDVGRFKYSTSYQAKYGNVTSNLVQECFNRNLQNIPN